MSLRKPRERMNPDVRFEQIMDTALELARATDYRMVTMSDLARAAGMSRPLASYYLGAATCLQDIILDFAISRGDARIVAQGIIASDPRALGAPVALRRKAIALMEVGL